MSAPSAPERLVVAGKFLRGRETGAKVFLRGVTYGPFPPPEVREAGSAADLLPPTGGTGAVVTSGGHREVPVSAGVLPGGVELANDLDRIVDLGANLVRVYTPPSVEFLDACGARGLRVMAGLPWASHVDFLRDGGGSWREIVEAQTAEVTRLSGHPALAVWVAGNEVESGLARWLGPARLLAALEDLIEALRAADPEALFVYSNYPTTEYLNPRNADFTAFNLYLEQADSLTRYLRRLQVLAGDRPVVIAEFGVDAGTRGEDVQARLLGEAVAAARREGLAGFVAFAFTDDWWRGGEVVSGWSFGLTRHDRSARPAAAVVRDAWSGGWLPERRAGDPVPLVSVIVCSHNGAGTLVPCLDSLLALRYPKFEIVLVDDGSTDGTPEVARSFAERGVVCVRQDHAGLGAARNHGAAVARGDLLAYTDDDCIADEHWLTCLVPAFDDPAIGAAGGPNIPPAPRSLVEACVAAAPGAPSHVLLDDRIAEHLPGCNLAVRRTAFERIGGFRREFAAAGDDVDFCWRLAEAGLTIVFVPSAMVWHHRRATASAYCRQQIGYGKAEALLIARHGGRFGRFGGARWSGVVYAAGPRSAADPGAHIYHGSHGLAPYQFIYGGGAHSPVDVVSGVQWALAAILLAAVLAVSGADPRWLAVPALMLAMTAARAVWRAGAVRVGGPHGPRGRALVFAFHLCQPILRGGARFLGCLRAGGRFGAAGGNGQRPSRKVRRFWISAGEQAFWSDSGLDRHAVLERLHDLMDAESRWQEIVPDPWDRWDAVYLRAGGSGFVFGVRTATEYHGRDRCLTHTRVGVGVARGLVAAYAAAALLVALSGFAWPGHRWPAVALGAAAALQAAGGVLFARSVSARVADAARRAGLLRCPTGTSGERTPPSRAKEGPERGGTST